MSKQHEWDGREEIPITNWGKDHWTTLLYIDSCLVDGPRAELAGVRVAKCQVARMRQEPGRPSRGWDDERCPPCEFPGRYPTRLADGVLLYGHDDWDCVSDMVTAGLVEWLGTGLQPLLKLTPHGTATVGALRAYITKHDGAWRGFVGRAA